MSLAILDAGAARPVRTNLLGVAEQPAMAESPYAIDRDGHPFVPAGDGGIVLGVDLGDGVFAKDADHAAPGVCLVHPDPAARLALAAQACIGNAVEVLSGAARGARGHVVGKRGEAGRVIARLDPDALARLVPGDRLRVEAFGQGARLAEPEGVCLMNLDPALVARLPVEAVGTELRVQTAGRVGARLVGNGVGRASALWDMDIQVTAEEADGLGLGGLRLGDLLAVDDWDARYNMGFRRGMVTVGVVVHGASRIPGHGPGVVALLTGPAAALSVVMRPAADSWLAHWLGPTASEGGVR